MLHFSEKWQAVVLQPLQILKFAERAEIDVTAWVCIVHHVWWLCRLQDQNVMDSAPNWSQITPPIQSVTKRRKTHTCVSDKWGPEQRPKGKAVQCKESFSWTLRRSLLNTRKWWCLSWTRSGENTRLCLTWVIYGIFTSGWVECCCMHTSDRHLEKTPNKKSACLNVINLPVWQHVARHPLHVVRVPVRVNISMFLSQPGLVFINTAAPTMFQNPSPVGPKTTSLSMLPGLWNNTPGFPITASPANGDRTENMCGQTTGWGRAGERSSRWQRWGLQGLHLEQRLSS